MKPYHRIFHISGRAAITLSALLLSGCWLSVNHSDDDDDGRSSRSCSDLDETICSRYDMLGMLDSDCEYTYYNCNELCQDDGWARAVGCDWEPRANEHRCMCTNDESCECSSSDASCYDANTILYCSDGCHWFGHDCDDLCRDSGFDHSVGCEYDAEGGTDACFCDEEPECECLGEAYACSSDFTILACDGCSWFEYDCDDVCASNGQGYSTGCGYDEYYGGDSCFCDDGWSDDCECVAGEYACWDDYTIASCDDGCYWYTTDCDDICWEGGFDYSIGCDYESGYGGAACFCESY